MHTILLLLFVASALAPQGQDQTKNAAANAVSTTINGCLVFSAREYRLIDNTGEPVELQNQANKLIHYVGQQVEITGQPGIETIGTTVDSLASSAEEIPVFKVVSVKSAGGACASDIKK